MESLETLALKSSLLSESPNQNNVTTDELSQVNVSIGGDDFSLVDSFLNLSSNEFQCKLSEAESVSFCQQGVTNHNFSDSSVTKNNSSSKISDSLDLSSSSKISDSLDLSSSSKISDSLDSSKSKDRDADFDSLEWLALFVEDPASDFTISEAIKPAKQPLMENSDFINMDYSFKPTVIKQEKPPLIQKKNYPVPCSNLSTIQKTIQKNLGKTRTNRKRICGTWSSSSLPEQDLLDLIPETEPKKINKTGNELVSRRCTHCQVQTTPQWRRGPKGPKTLCNACGVRFKSGRLCDEYRPACSPTFSGKMNSNSHRKVLELRKNGLDMGSKFY